MTAVEIIKAINELLDSHAREGASPAAKSLAYMQHAAHNLANEQSHAIKAAQVGTAEGAKRCAEFGNQHRVEAERCARLADREYLFTYGRGPTSRTDTNQEGSKS